MKGHGKRAERRARKRWPMVVAAAGLVCAMLAIGIGFWASGVGREVHDPAAQGGPNPTGTGGTARQADILADVQTVWIDLFRSQFGEPFRPAIAVSAGGMGESACGAIAGPVFCAADGRIILGVENHIPPPGLTDAEADVVAAFRVARAVAQHAQNELGILGQANRMRADGTGPQARAISARLDLQADCYVGVWAHHAAPVFGVSDRGALTAAMDAARRTGANAGQGATGPIAPPRIFGHATSEQHRRWFARGLGSGDLNSCDTFGANRL